MLRPHLGFVEQEKLYKKVDPELFVLRIPNSRDYMALCGRLVLRNRILLHFALEKPTMSFLDEYSLVSSNWHIVPSPTLW